MACIAHPGRQSLLSLAPHQNGLSTGRLERLYRSRKGKLSARPVALQHGPRSRRPLGLLSAPPRRRSAEFQLCAGLKPRLLLSKPGFRLPFLVQLVASPKQAARDQVEIHVSAHRLVAVAEGRAEHSRFAVGIDPDGWMPVTFF